MAADGLEFLRRSGYRAFLESSWALQSVERQGHLQELLTTHTARISHALVLIANGLVAAFAFVALMLSSFVVDVRAAAAVLVCTVLLFFALRPLSRLARRATLAYRSANLDYVHAVSESVTLALEDKTFDVGAARLARTEAIDDGVVAPFFRSQFLSRLVPGLYQSAAMIVILAGFVAALTVGRVDVGTLGASVLLLVRALSYSQTLQLTFHQIHEVGPFTEQVEEQQARYRSAAVSRAGDPLDHIERIAFRDVWFSYLPGRAVLKGFSFEVTAGEAIGIVGPSGGGKSTLVQMLLRLRPPDRGAYEINGRPANGYSLDSWYERVAFLPQDCRLMAGTVAENIRYLRDSIPTDAVVAAARATGIHDEIMSWPLGYEAVVGDRGATLSGGQRQRLCLARALVGGPDVLVLDEPTSALDARSEALVQESLEWLKGRVTLFIVAHRLSTLSICDRTMVMERGEIRSFAEPALLLDSSDYYREATTLWQLR
jgi:ATP-binding cassette subfamily B protein